MKNTKPFPFHILLIGVYPILALFALNIQEITAISGLRALILSAAFAMILFLVYKLIQGDWHKAGLSASLTVILFFSYGHIYQAIRGSGDLGNTLGRHRYLLPVLAAFFIAGLYWIARKMKSPREVNRAVNIVSLVLLAWPVFQIASFYIADAANLARMTSGETPAMAELSPDELPDVYYIILDGYARDDTLKDFYGYNNSAFLDELTKRGFYVATCSRSNYVMTRLSLSSSLNRDYLEKINLKEDSNNAEQLAWRLIQKNRVREDFEALGYTTVAFETGYYWTEWTDADLYLSKDSGGQDTLSKIYGFGKLNNFEVLFIRTTLLQALLDLETQLSRGFTTIVDEGAKKTQYDTVSFTLDALLGITEIPEPTFVFAHILAPHHPYVFGPDGEFTPVNGSYINQVQFINHKILEVVDGILAQSETPPIIILQADHSGPGTNPYPFRLNILNAYYLPGGGNDVLYSSITPVNTFRLVFDNYFGTDFGLLEDISYHSTYENYFDGKVYPDTRQGCGVMP
jgi:hypothetical protein